MHFRITITNVLPYSLLRYWIVWIILSFVIKTSNTGAEAKKVNTEGVVAVDSPIKADKLAAS